ncbi:MAG: phage integrase N-terminal SAM-like domain-containing protein, partial [Theionarchaea archaeon]|nr:phage integrase N-terminal SAM-like domain-containing protein [Theionarchaea archaeon]
MICVVYDVLEDFSLYLRVEKRISEGVAKNYCYSVGRFLRWVDTPNPTRKDAVKYIDRLMKDKKKESTVRNILHALKHYYSF